MGFYYYPTARWYYNSMPDSLRGGTYGQCASNNALQIFVQLYNYGWTKNAIYGALGNIESEGILNPGQYQVTTSGEINYNLGFGLVQWSPSQNYIIHAKEYAVPRGYLTEAVANALTFDNDSVYDGYVQCAQIAAAMNTEGQYTPQWAKVAKAPITALQFTQSTIDYHELATYWLYGYERPKDPWKSEATRRKNAEGWHDYIEGYGASNVPQQGGQLPEYFPAFSPPGDTPVLPPTTPVDPSPEIPPDPNPPDPEPGTPVINKVYVQPTVQYAKIGDRVKVKAVGYGNVSLDEIQFIVDTSKLQILEIRNGECTVLVLPGAAGGAFIRAQWSRDISIEQTVLIQVDGFGGGSKKWIYYLKPLLR